MSVFTLSVKWGTNARDWSSLGMDASKVLYRIKTEQELVSVIIQEFDNELRAREHTVSDHH